MIFEKKKIQIETLSEYLTSVRLNLDLSREEVCKKTGISLKFLDSLETGNFKILPADVYVNGFLKQLATLYSVDQEPLIDQYKKELGISQQLSKTTDNFSGSWRKKYFGKVIVTPKILSFGMGALFVAMSLAYIIWQVWSINKTPSLEIFQPADNSVIAASFVSVLGRTDPGMNVTVNGQTIFVDSSGGFQTQLGLSPGSEEISITAKNRFNKTFSKTVNITGAAPAPGSISPQLQLKVDFTSAVVLTVTIDSQASQTLTFNQGDSKIFMANKQAVLSTSDAGATKITLNGQVLGPMGRPKEVLNNVFFYPPPPVLPTPGSGQ